MADPVGTRPHMPQYGVDTPEWEALPWSWARERLETTRTVWFVTVSGDGRPHSLPVWGVWNDDEHRFGFSCAPSSRKARNIDANPRCVVTTENGVECVSLEGLAQPVTDIARKVEWIERYLAKYQAISHDLSADFLRANLIVEVVPERAFAIIEHEHAFATRATRWMFVANTVPSG